jgi:hypothetical protein
VRWYAILWFGCTERNIMFVLNTNSAIHLQTTIPSVNLAAGASRVSQDPQQRHISPVFRGWPRQLVLRIRFNTRHGKPCRA